MDGKGILYYQPNCPAYNGEWYNDQFHGYGTLFNEKAQELSEEYDYEDMNEVEDFWCRYEGTDGFMKVILCLTIRRGRGSST